MLLQIYILKYALLGETYERSPGASGKKATEKTLLDTEKEIRDNEVVIIETTEEI